ncbi:hypothetical protein [Methylocucumis oryzae]|uniref:hypothetical protein n=1 Tax=Methylocucumis oryzae TaxID=1632867 RepID=UPI001EF9DEEC|nr:hypothetical protein [Methylocucumis oryzae]
MLEKEIADLMNAAIIEHGEVNKQLREVIALCQNGDSDARLCIEANTPLARMLTS